MSDLSEIDIELARKRRDRAEKKAAAANKENDRLRAEIRQMRLKNFTLQRYLDDPASQSGYLRRYEALYEAVAMARDMLNPVLNGLPPEAPKTLEPARPPMWARVRFTEHTDRGL